MISMPLIAWCVAAGGVFLLICQWLLDQIEKILVRKGLFGSLDTALLEETGFGRTISEFFASVGVFVFLPTMLFSFLYTVVPFEGPRAGVAIALGVTALGVAPVLISVSMRIKLPTAALAYIALTHFVKLSGTLFIIGYLFSL